MMIRADEKRKKILGRASCLSNCTRAKENRKRSDRRLRMGGLDEEDREKGKGWTNKYEDCHAESQGDGGQPFSAPQTDSHKSKQDDGKERNGSPKMAISRASAAVGGVQWPVPPWPVRYASPRAAPDFGKLASQNSDQTGRKQQPVCYGLVT
jgi:hypothetical protein